MTLSNFRLTLQDGNEAISRFQDKKQNGAKPNGMVPGITLAAKDCIGKLCSDFGTRLSNDLHTPYILNAYLQKSLRFINYSTNQPKKKQ